VYEPDNHFQNPRTFPAFCSLFSSSHPSATAIKKKKWTSWFQNFALFWMLYSFFCGISPASEFDVPAFQNTPFHLQRRCSHHLIRWNRQSDLKRRRIHFRRRGTPQKEEYETWTYFLLLNTPLTCSYELHAWIINKATTNINCMTTRPSHSITQLLAAVAVTPGMLTAGEQLFVTGLLLLGSHHPFLHQPPTVAAQSDPNTVLTRQRH